MKLRSLTISPESGVTGQLNLHAKITAVPRGLQFPEKKEVCDSTRMNFDNSTYNVSGRKNLCF